MLTHWIFARSFIWTDRAEIILDSRRFRSQIIDEKFEQVQQSMEEMNQVILNLEMKFFIRWYLTQTNIRFSLQTSLFYGICSNV